MSMEDIKEVRNEIEARRLRRRGRLEAIEDVAGFLATKVSGTTMLFVGILEYLMPDVIAAVLPEPLAIAGVGFTLIAGKRAAKALLTVLEQLAK